MVLEFMKGKIQIPVDHIMYVESRLHKIYYHVLSEDGIEKEYSKYGKLSDAQQELREYGFCRTHQSYLVNMEMVVDVQRYQATLEGGIWINISKKYYKDIETEFVKNRREYKMEKVMPAK